MLEQYQEWNTIEQETMQEVIRRLLSQTFLLDRKYDKRAAGWPPIREYEFCADHMAFLTEYFAVAGITIHQIRAGNYLHSRRGEAGRAADQADDLISAAPEADLR